jgi:hypothetical protein
LQCVNSFALFPPLYNKDLFLSGFHWNFPCFPLRFSPPSSIMSHIFSCYLFPKPRLQFRYHHIYRYIKKTIWKFATLEQKIPLVIFMDSLDQRLFVCFCFCFLRQDLAIYPRLTSTSLSSSQVLRRQHSATKPGMGQGFWQSSPSVQTTKTKIP